MLAIFLKTLPFFAIIALGYAAGRMRFFSAEATGYLTKFVFYFALSAMLFGFAANLDLSDVFSWGFVWAYLLASTLIWALVGAGALLRGTGRATRLPLDVHLMIEAPERLLQPFADAGAPVQLLAVRPDRDCVW
ncbi:MAG: hypothetical protein RI979_1181, partial [Pseudomonadota bacterium]